MGFWNDLLETLGLDFGKRALDYGQKQLENETIGLSKAQREQNEWQSTENERAFERESTFNAKMAEEERAWQEEMAEKYNSLSGKMEQAREAGVNPMFAVTGSAVSPASAGSAGAASASAHSGGSSAGARPMGSPHDLIQQFIGMSKVKAEVDNINAQTKLMNEQALAEKINNVTRGEMNETTIRQMLQDIATSAAEEQYKIAKTGEVAATIRNMDADTNVKVKQLDVMATNILHMQADIDLKAGQLAECLANVSLIGATEQEKKANTALLFAKCDNEKLMKYVIRAQYQKLKSSASLDKAQIRKIGKEVDELEATIAKLWQDYDHDAIMNGFNEVIAGETAEHVKSTTYDSKFAYHFNLFIDRVLGFFGSVYSVNTATITSIDGTPHSSGKKVGFK